MAKRKSEKEVFAFNLKRLRIEKGLNVADLAEDLGVTPQAIYKLERGDVNPSAKLVFGLQSKGFPLEDLLDEDAFEKQGVEELEIVEPEFREGGLSEEEKSNIQLDTLQELKRLIKLEGIINEKLKFINPLDGFGVIRKVEDAERAARVVRKRWQLYDNPITNVIALLEKQGVRVIEFLSNPNFFGMAAWVNEIPVIALNKNTAEVCRKRFTACHELAHLILDIKAGSPKEIERICDGFAAAMLLPKEILLWEVGTKNKLLDNDQLAHLKERYGISLQAILVNAVFAKIISWKKYHERMETLVDIDAKYCVREEASRFKQMLLRAVNEGIIDEKRARLIRAASPRELAYA